MRTYVRTPENTAWMRVPWTCPKCQKVYPTSGHENHLSMCGREAEHFWTRVDKSGDCWIHNGCRDKWGYAQHGVKGKRHQAHRLAWQFTNGPIPAGMKVLHRCDNPPCCNAESHLFLGTDADNMMDKLLKGRVHDRKLTPEQVVEVRSLLGVIPQSHIARKLGVSTSVIWKLKMGKTYTVMPLGVPASKGASTK